jgi:hypothetical protein
MVSLLLVFHFIKRQDPLQLNPTLVAQTLDLNISIFSMKIALSQQIHCPSLFTMNGKRSPKVSLHKQMQLVRSGLRN